MSVRDQPLATRAYREQLSNGKASREENHSMANYRTRARRMLAALLHSPQFPPGERIVRVRRLRPEADHLPAPVDPFDLRSRKRLALIAVIDWFSVLVQVLEIDRALRLPDRLPGRRIERDYELA